MADFREKIHQLENTHTKDDLIDLLAENVGQRVTSVNPTTEAMFDRIAPNVEPIDYALRSTDYADGLQPVAKNALALKLLLHEQVGRPLYERVLTLKKRDFAECITAVDVYDEGYERGSGLHTPTTPPREVDAFVSSPPDRTETPDSPFDTLTELEEGYEADLTRWVDQNPDLAAADYCTYVLDCTPAVEEENEKVWDLRRAVQTKIEAGIPTGKLMPGEEAAHALNEGKRVYYVGSTGDLVQRIHEHVVGTAKSGVDFTTIMPPKQLVEVHPCESRPLAKASEGDRARDLRRTDEVFAYSDEM